MHVGLDIDDTISCCPEFFSVISQALLDRGHTVTVISFREDRAFAEEDVAEYGVVYTEQVLPTEEEYQRIIAHDWRTEAGKWKAEVCQQLGVDILFDDMPEVINALGEDTKGFMAVNTSLGKIAHGS